MRPVLLTLIATAGLLIAPAPSMAALPAVAANPVAAPPTGPRRPTCRDVLPRLAAGARARGFRVPGRSRGLCRGGGREGHLERGTPTRRRPLGRGQRPQGMDRGRPRGEGRELAVPA